MEFPEINEESFTEFRANAIGSSDMAVLMGISPYKTKYQLWMEKTGLKEPDNIPSFVMQRGIDNEEQVRTWFNEKHDCNCIVDRKIDSEFDYLRANADGVDYDKNIMIEIKCGGLEDHIAACNECKVPDKYYPQVRFLSHVFKMPIYYVSYNSSYSPMAYTAFLVPPDEVFTNNMLKEAHAFWESVITKTEPPLSDQDDMIVEDGDIVELVNAYGDLKAEIDKLTNEMKSVQNLLSKRVTHKKTICNGYKMNWVERKGSVDYSRVPLQGGVDLEDYRKKTSSFFTIKRVKRNET